MEDKELIVEILNGNQQAFKKLVEDNQKLVLNVCYKFTGISEDAEDIVQEVFCEAFRSISKFNENCKISSWLYKIAVSKSIDFLRTKKRKKRLAVLTSLFGFETGEEIHPTSENYNPFNMIENQEQLKILMKFVNKLSEKQKTAFTLSQIDSMSYKEISEVMELSISSIESLIFRARKKLKAELIKFYQRNKNCTSFILSYRLIK